MIMQSSNACFGLALALLTLSQLPFAVAADAIPNGTNHAPQVFDVVPLDRPYSKFSNAQKALFASEYDALDRADQPPFPIDGIAPLIPEIRSAAQDQLSLRSKVKIRMLADISESGTVTATSLLGPAPEASEIPFVLAVSKALTKARFQPALCSGKPCAMAFPLYLELTENSAAWAPTLVTGPLVGAHPGSCNWNMPDDVSTPDNPFESRSVVIAYRPAENGSILVLGVVQSSGFPALDSAAIKILSTCKPRLRNDERSSDESVAHIRLAFYKSAPAPALESPQPVPGACNMPEFPASVTRRQVGKLSFSVQALIEASGALSQTRIHQSTGDKAVDDQMASQLSKCRWRPGKNIFGEPTPGRVEIAVTGETITR
ncbi:hypothetical protein GCM10025771_02560 [Niveibacterium umoris]